MINCLLFNLNRQKCCIYKARTSFTTSTNKHQWGRKRGQWLVPAIGKVGVDGYGPKQISLLV